LNTSALAQAKPETQNIPGNITKNRANINMDKFCVLFSLSLSSILRQNWAVNGQETQGVTAQLVFPAAAGDLLRVHQR
jgi:hypothetical protein